MKRSADQILTSHVGSLPRPAELLALYKSGASGSELEAGVSSAVADVVKKQLDTGINVVNDGEYGKPSTEAVDFGAWQNYFYDRVAGFETRKVDLSELSGMKVSRDFNDFADYYMSPEAAEGGSGDLEISVNVGDIHYHGQELIQRDIANLKSALPNGHDGAAFLTALSTGLEGYRLPPEHYSSSEEESMAMAEAMRTEFTAIADAGLIVQLDDPWLVDVFSMHHSMEWDLEGYRKWAERHVEIVNHSIAGIPSEQVRFHICWGSWKGPHSSDLPLKDVVDILLKINADLYSVEAANPMHEHEWHVWEDVKLPEGKIIMPGVVSHKTNILEHPEVVADRIVRYANAVGRENVIAGTDCGMGGRINPGIAWAKLKALADGAELASRRLWS